MDGLLEELTHREFLEWVAYERVEGPLGPGRQDYYLAQIAAVLANVHRDEGKRREPWTVQDFLLFGEHAGSPAPEGGLAGDTPEGMLAVLLAMSGKGPNAVDLEALRRQRGG